MRITLVHNPKAGGPQEHPDADTLMDLIRKAGHDVATWSSEDLSDIEDAVAACDLIAIAGGDGTAGRIAKRLVGCPVPITFIPIGTANNISRSLGLLDCSLEQLIAGWQGAPTRQLDIGVIEAPWGSHHFIEGVGVGVFTRTMCEIDAFNRLAHLTTPQEKIASALTLLSERLRTYPVRRMELLLDDRDLSGDYLMMEAMNIRFVGPNLYVAPGCDPGDGLLDVVLVAERERDSLLSHLASWRQGTLLAPALPTYRGSRLRFEWHGHAMHVDDEAWPPEHVGECSVPSTIDIRVEKHALRVLIPAAASGH
jgi:diacylglycerol kinase (ATP)